MVETDEIVEGVRGETLEKVVKEFDFGGREFAGNEAVHRKGGRSECTKFVIVRLMIKATRNKNLLITCA